MSNSYATTHGKNPKQIHIAHRRSPSELTNLMIEQIALQRQLELVQQQQQQIINQQFQQPLQRTNSHRRAQSSITGAMGSFSFPANPGNSLAPPPKLGHQSQNSIGHIRRHSLGLNEAKKAAAQVQAQRAGKDTTTDENEETTSNSSNSNNSGFKFPSTSVEPSSPSRPNRNSTTSPQRTYQFPPKSPQQSSQQFLNPNDVNNNFQYHDRRQSGHFRTNSRNNFDSNNNWRRNQSPSKEEFQQPFIPGHRSRGSYGGTSFGGSISSMNGLNQQNGRKSLFAPYLPQSSIPELVSEGRLVVGTLRVNKKNRSDAYVSTDGLLDADIFICGSKDRNRALEGDLVAVELLSVDEVWSSKREKAEKKRRKDNHLETSDDVHNDASTHKTSTSTVEDGSLKRRGSLKQRPTLKKNDDVEVEGQSLLLVEEEEISDEYKPLYAGHVVAVIDRIPGQLFAGTLGLLRPSQQQQKDSSIHNKPKIVWFKPTDKKVPLIAIPTEQAPRDFVENVDKYTNKLFIASIKRWPITSLHPFGTLVGELGDLNDPDIEVDAILRDNNFICDEYLSYDGGVERDDFELNNVDMEKEYSERRDFTNEYVLALSETGSFSDSGIHVKRLDKDKIELGVHISDVTKFIREGSILDKNARKRSTSVFLAQKCVDLLPQKVMNFLSFDKFDKSLSISVIFEIDTTKFEVDNIWIGESFIQPKIKLTFDQIDSILKDEDDGVSSNASKDYIKTIALISREFKRQRLNNSKLTNDINLTLLDQIDDERIRLHLNLFENNLSFNVLNEIFLKVNETVAQRTYSILGDQTFLRRQGLPTLTKIENFKKKVENFGIEIDTSSSSNLINSILNIKDETIRKIVEILLYKSLTRSKYFIAGKIEPENYGAYYFNLDLYTHFTSPLRRYGDFISHRQLKQVLHNEINEIGEEELESLKMTAEYCNFKKDCAKAAQDQSIHLLLSQTINEMSSKTGQLIVLGTISQVYESAFDIFIPEFGIEKRIHGDQLPLKKCEFDKKSGILELYWEKGIDSATFIPQDERNPLSYRNSIKNKFQIGANDIVKIDKDEISDELSQQLSNLKLKAPVISQPQTQTSTSSSVDKYFEGLRLREEDNNYIQEIRELEVVPVLLRSEIGMALPCLTVHALNPFINAE